MYKILNGSYIAAPAGSLPPLAETEDRGSTPSLFTKSRTSAVSGKGQQDPHAASRVRQAAAAGGAIDKVTLAAAELIVARARYERSLHR